MDHRSFTIRLIDDYERALQLIGYLGIRNYIYMAAASPDIFRVLHNTDTNENDSSDTTLNRTIENAVKLAMDESRFNKI